MKKSRNERDQEMLDGYDFSGGVRGKYVKIEAMGVDISLPSVNGIDGSPRS